MCGIALIVSGVRIVSFDSYTECCRDRAVHSDGKEVYEPDLPIDDLKASLYRRGPDNLSCRKVLLHPHCMSSVANGDEVVKKVCSSFGELSNGCTSSALQAAAGQEDGDIGVKPVAELCFFGATLQLRGINAVSQPLVSTSGNILVYNGEIFGGIHVASDQNDAKSLLNALDTCCSCDNNWHDKGRSCVGNGGKTVPEILSTIKGPWALIYWQEKSKTIWFGRDAFGRRSLLVHWPNSDKSQFVLCSSSPPSMVTKDFGSVSSNDGSVPGEDPPLTETICKLSYWEELPCGIYSVCLPVPQNNTLPVKEELICEVKKHEWNNSLLSKLIKWERTSVIPKLGEFCLPANSLEKELDTNCSLTKNVTLSGYQHSIHKVLTALRESVLRRTTVSREFQGDLHEVRGEGSTPIAILFSGGLDSMILGALLDKCLNPKYTIDLLNVSFDGQLAPDRVSAKAGLRELQRISPLRRWRLVEIDASLSHLKQETEHVLTLIHPTNTYMITYLRILLPQDLNIGIALWLAAGGVGWVDGELCKLHKSCDRYKYKSASKVLLVGSGADEQCAGYGRHRTKFRLGGWVALHEEMRLDMQRIWKRNMGRDDRCISDHGKEARFPFLDEDVIATLLEIPLWEIAELDKPVGTGDKKILREVAKLLGLQEAALLPKRAIQFGSRIARESNRKNFGSNRAANQASAGSVVIRQPQNKLQNPQ
ncbi:asparagine synthetase domain-containing protein 1 isoform X1 [Ananas comosus]|uniref:Asparagine synthetase domain-containing protein 1 isoform X1 n=1 Tax=Ananas comosus TaxID=4615 RepID=A0A6P5FK12_ANACO|nr:asparagine synthetase domain-containing protein 1 isoform X1 [Ananas comosus]